METVLEAYLANLRELRDGFHQAAADLPPAALDWSPGPEMNSIAVLLAHTAGSLRYWVGEVVGLEPAGRDRPAEFRTAGLGAADLLRRLDDALAHGKGVLGRLAPTDLSAIHHVPLSDRDVSVAWALDHALAHTATHLGHVQLTRQLWAQAGTS
jgi:hypothetical protein